jgi:hypothetical protein
MTTSAMRDIVTIVGVVIGGISLVFTAFNTRLTSRSNRARFWLDLRDRFARHDDAHRHLRPGGKWSGGGAPTTPEEWADLEAYMGLFEHCEIMMRQGLIDGKTFEKIYGYRVQNIVSNNAIRKTKLVQLSHGWQDFLALVKRLRITVPR